MTIWFKALLTAKKLELQISRILSIVIWVHFVSIAALNTMILEESRL